MLAENWRGRTSHEHPSVLFAGTPVAGEAGRGLGSSPGVERQPRSGRRANADGRRIVQWRALPSRRGRPRTGRFVLGSRSRRDPSTGGLTPATWGFHRHLAPGRVIRRRPVRCCSTRGRRCTSTTTRNASGTRLGRLRRRDRTVRARRRLVRVASRPLEGPRRLVRLVGDVSRRTGSVIGHVRSLGMEFGIWVEPEMVNPDSDLYRAHRSGR